MYRCTTGFNSDSADFDYRCFTCRRRIHAGEPVYWLAGLAAVIAGAHTVWCDACATPDEADRWRDRIIAGLDDE